MNICDVCGSGKNVEIRSSGIAPVSLAICEKCNGMGAENLDIVLVWIYENGGEEFAQPFKTRLVSHLEGAYIGWPKIKQIYIEQMPEIEILFREEFQ